MTRIKRNGYRLADVTLAVTVVFTVRHAIVSISEHSPAIDTRPGHANRLEVGACGSDFVFLINGQQVGMMTADIEPGQIGLGADSARRADTAQVGFSDFEIHAP